MVMGEGVMRVQWGRRKVVRVVAVVRMVVTGAEPVDIDGGHTVSVLHLSPVSVAIGGLGLGLGQDLVLVLFLVSLGGRVSHKGHHNN